MEDNGVFEPIGLVDFSWYIEDGLRILGYGVVSGFALACILSLMGYGIYKLLHLIERST